MKLYIVEAPVKEAATPYWARTCWHKFRCCDR